MIVLTAGNFRFKTLIKTSVKQAKKFGYKPVVYDLGGLGFGEPFKVDNALFHKRGYYWKLEDAGGRQTKAFHKPSVIKNCLDNKHEFIVYLDGDAILIDKIDAIVGDYDIGVTVRPQAEVEETIRRSEGTTRIIDGYINAGVMFFNNTKATMRFINMWSQENKRLKHDQTALNSLLQRHFPLKPNQTIDLEGIKIRFFDTRIYNYYYFSNTVELVGLDAEDIDIKNAKILHFKNDRREHYEHYFKSSLLVGLAKRG